MHKYLFFLKQYWQNMLTYRLSFMLWRLREFTSSLMALTVWQVIFANQEVVFGYQRNQIMAYVFLSTILHNLIATSSLNNLAGDIYSGKISTTLVKPVNIFLAWGFQDLADKLLNFGFVLLESSLLFFIFKPTFNFPSFEIGLVFILWTLLAVLISFIINILFGMIGFWSPDAWGPKFLFFMLLDFTAGKLYPLDILPVIIQKIINYTPFPYLSYFQTQLFLGRFPTQQIFTTTLIMLSWIIGLSLFLKIIWNKGIKNYTAMGQ